MILPTGFYLGKLVGDRHGERSVQKVTKELTEMSRKVTELDHNLRKTFHQAVVFSSVMSEVQCDYLRQKSPNDTFDTSVHEILDELNSCFNI